MDLDLVSLRCFVTAAREGGVARAARVLNLAQPALSRRLRLLEESLGAPLLTRSRRGVAPTEAGALLLLRAEALLRQVHELRAELDAAAAAPTGLVRVGYPPSFAALFFGRLLADVARTYPRVVLQLRETFSRDVRDALLRDEIDLGVGAWGSGGPDLVGERLFDEEVWLAGAPERWPFAGRAAVPQEALAGLPLIYSSYFQSAVDAAGGGAAAAAGADAASLRLRADAMTSIREFALAGGALLLGAPSAVHDLLAEGRLVGAPIEGLVLERALYRRRDHAPTRAAEALIAMLRERLEATLPLSTFVRPAALDRRSG